MVAAARGHAGDIEQVLGGKGEAGERPAGAALDPDARSGYERTNVVGHAANAPGRDDYSAGAAGRRPLTRQRLAQPGLKRMPVNRSNQM